MLAPKMDKANKGRNNIYRWNNGCLLPPAICAGRLVLPHLPPLQPATDVFLLTHGSLLGQSGGMVCYDETLNTLNSAVLPHLN